MFKETLDFLISWLVRKNALWQLVSMALLQRGIETLGRYKSEVFHFIIQYCILYWFNSIRNSVIHIFHIGLIAWLLIASVYECKIDQTLQDTFLIKFCCLTNSLTTISWNYGSFVLFVLYHFLFLLASLSEYSQIALECVKCRSRCDDFWHEVSFYFAKKCSETSSFKRLPLEGGSGLFLFWNV